MSRPITIRDAHGSVTAPPERMQALLAERAAVKPMSVKAFRSSVLRKKDKRAYPRFVEGMSTAEYVERYWQLNGCVIGLQTYRSAAATPLLETLRLMAVPKEVFRLIGETYEPLGTTPQYSQDDLVEESCE